MNCQKPLFVFDGQKRRHVLVGCGDCNLCRRKKAIGWLSRIKEEEKTSDTAFFITLTYSDEWLPVSENDLCTLLIKDVQDYMKRVRSVHDYYTSEFGEYVCPVTNVISPVKVRKKLKYYVVGEYGGQFKRPHYHVLLFNADISLMYGKNEIDQLNMSNYDGKWRVEAKQWKFGVTSVGKVSDFSTLYCMQYIYKPGEISQALVGDAYVEDDRLEQFSLKSKGIGKCYIGKWEKQKYYRWMVRMTKSGPKQYYWPLYKDVLIEPSASVRWHKSDLTERCYYPLEDGKKATLSRYFKELIYTKDEKEVIYQHYVDKNIEEINNEMGIFMEALNKAQIVQEEYIQKRCVTQTRIKELEKIAVYNYGKKFRHKRDRATRRAWCCSSYAF